VPDPAVHGATWLSAFGGLALIVLGLKTLSAGRRAE
jgi:hypothetical protein